jgi:hypothetical protein
VNRSLAHFNSPLSTDLLTFIILYNNLIPISYAALPFSLEAVLASTSRTDYDLSLDSRLIVTMEVVKYQQAQLINSDLDMFVLLGCT